MNNVLYTKPLQLLHGKLATGRAAGCELKLNPGGLDPYVYKCNILQTLVSKRVSQDWYLNKKIDFCEESNTQSYVGYSHHLYGK
jgi:hypothetical protein